MRRSDDDRERLAGAGRRRVLLVAWAILLTLSGAMAAAEWLPLPAPFLFILLWFFLLVVCTASTLVEGVFQLLAVVFDRRFKPRLLTAASMLLVACVGATTAVALLLAGNRIRARAFARAADRADPLIAAIDGFVAEHGRPPSGLDALVPDWIDAIPSTSLLTYPDFWYEPSDLRRESYWEVDGLPPTWSLRIHCGRGFANWDVFIYYPDGLYEGVGRRWGGWHELIRGWAYVHE
ncbi:MAG: hypothetical protein AAGA20_18280 [Planctomycetota bacterium]